MNELDYDGVIELARAGRSGTPGAGTKYRAEFLELVASAQEIERNSR